MTPVVPLRQPRPRSRRRPFAAGDAVEVPRYGKGRVVRAVANEVTVEFAGGDDVRTFVASYVRRIVRAGREMTEVSAAAD
ncbi:MAG TPA: hypothetical protein VNE58_05785 [Casimicrobiaceae bacterium]|nr:hypothetical protein [Casimicrobiaceae bacterium]